MVELYKNLKPVVREQSASGVREVATGIEDRAKTNLAAHAAVRIDGLSNVYSITGPEEVAVAEFLVSLESTAKGNPAALEYGHDPSGHFAGTKTKPPAATYILTGAAFESGGKQEFRAASALRQGKRRRRSSSRFPEDNIHGS